MLVGFMASGKTTVGREVAARLGWEFVDFDAEIERRTGRLVAELFDVEGEPAFRSLEAEVGSELLDRGEVVLASGGGWAAVPGRIDAVPPGTLTVWLRIDAATALDRAASEPALRPLLAGPSRVAAVEALLHSRAPHYARAEVHLDAIGPSPEALGTAIVNHVQSSRGRPGHSSKH